MARAGTILRRTFLVGSAALAGGVAFGVYAVRRPHKNPLEDQLADGETTFNPWVKIGPERITLIAPHADIGQGVRSLQAALIAEEMDLDFGQFDVEPGPPAAAYWNTASAEEAVPFQPTDKGFVAESARTVVGSVLKLVGLQITGGSSTAPDSFDKLRIAGAVARETLKAAAAREHGIAVSELRTKSGAVILPDGSALPYTSLAAAAAAIEPATDVTPRDPARWRLLGRPMQRLDVVAKSTGTMEFGIDLAKDGMRYATVRFNPRQGGALNGYDAKAAESMPGVERVLEVSNGVAVIADNTWNAFQAAAAIDCDWGPAPYPAEMDEHWKALADSFVEDRLDREWRHDGDVPLALADRGDPLELEYRAPYVAHAPLEPLNALILNSGDRVDIWVAHQIPRVVQDKVADLTGVDAGSVYVHNLYGGGSFGHRLEFENVHYAAEIAAQMQGVPIKLTFEREEDTAHDYPRHPGIARATGLVTEDGVDTLDLSIAAPSVMASQVSRMGMPAAGPDAQIAAGAWVAPYAIPNFRVRAYRAPELAPVSSWRSVGASSAGFFMESAMDELIVAAGKDPLMERLRLVRDPVARQVLEAVGEMSNWGSATREGSALGVALVTSFGVPTAEVVEVSTSANGIRIDRVWVAADVGRVLDPVNFENQVQGGVIWGLGHAINSEITYADGMAEQRNFHHFPALRLSQCPQIEVRGLENGAAVKGIGEPPVPPAAPALANAIFAATGERLRAMPFNRFVDFA